MRNLVLSLGLVLSAFAGAAATTSALAVETEIVIRVLAKDAKFIGSSMGGVAITLRDAHSGEILAEGATRGSTGDTRRLIQAPRLRDSVLSTDGSALFSAVLDLDRPRLIEVEARGPLSQLQSAVTITSQQWVLPGKPINQGDGWLLEMPGLAVDALAPANHAFLGSGPREVVLRANVTMMCGCGVSPGGFWDADDMEIGALIERDGVVVGEAALAYAGETSQFEATIEVEPGVYVATLYAYQPSTGNTGLDKTTFIVR